MKLHPRTLVVQRASVDIRQKIFEVALENNLTYAEVMLCIQDAIQNNTRWALRRERHGEHSDKGADEA